MLLGLFWAGTKGGWLVGLSVFNYGYEKIHDGGFTMNGKMVLAGKIAVGLGVVVLLAYLALALAGGDLIGTTLDLDKSAAIGTFVGGTVGALWALAGVFFFYAALQLQREDFNLQRAELEATRKVFERQAFETTFFNLIEQKRLFEQVLYDGGMNPTKLIARMLQSVIKKHNQHFDKDFSYSTYEHNYSNVAEFLSLVCILFDFIDAANLKWEDAERYASIIKGTTSAEGRALYLFYMFTCENGCPKNALELGFFDGLSKTLFSEATSFPFSEFTYRNEVLCRKPSTGATDSKS